MQRAAASADWRRAQLPRVLRPLAVLYGLARGVMAPKGTPAGVIKFWEDAFAKAAKDATVIKTLEGGGSTVLYKDAKGYGEFLKAGYEEHERLAIKIGMYKK